MPEGGQIDMTNFWRQLFHRFGGQPRDDGAIENAAGVFGAPGGQGTTPTSPAAGVTLRQLHEAGIYDWQRGGIAREQSYQQKAGALDQLRADIEGLIARQGAYADPRYDAAIARAESAGQNIKDSAAEALRRSRAATAEGIGDITAGERGSLEDIGGAVDRSRVEYNKMQTGINRAWEDVKGQLGGTLEVLKEARAFTLGGVDKVWKQGATALAEFTDKVGDRQTEWATAHQAQLREQKTNEAARLKAEGYTGREIEERLRQMDWKGAQEQAGQFASFQRFEEDRRSQLRFGYDQLGAQTTTAAMGVMSGLAGVEASARMGAAAAAVNLQGMRNGAAQWMGQTEQWAATSRGAVRMSASQQRNALRLAQNQMEAWKAGMDASAETAAVEARMRVTDSRVAQKNAISLAGMSGLSNLAGMWQNLDRTFEPLMPLMAGMFSLQLGLDDRNMMADASGLQNWLNGILTTQGGAANLSSVISQTPDT
ncbi:MAG: hypothetical protein ACE5FA_00695 [Dehalococcoidia bacterium]